MVVVNQWLNVTTNTKEDRHCVRLRDTRNASNIHTHTHKHAYTHTHLHMQRIYMRKLCCAESGQNTHWRLL